MICLMLCGRFSGAAASSIWRSAWARGSSPRAVEQVVDQTRCALPRGGLVLPAFDVPALGILLEASAFREHLGDERGIAAGQVERDVALDQPDVVHELGPEHHTGIDLLVPRADLAGPLVRDWPERSAEVEVDALGA